MYENVILAEGSYSKETDSCRIGAGSVSPPAQPGSPDARKPIDPAADGYVRLVAGRHSEPRL